MDYLDTRPWKTKPSEFPEKWAEWVDDQLEKLMLLPQHDVRMVDWGAGTGDFMRGFARIGYVVEGFDMLVHDDKIRQLDLSKPVSTLTIKNETADVAICRNVLEHMNDPTELLIVMHRTLKAKGCAVIAVPDWRTYHEIFYADHTHVRPYDRVSITNLLRVSGFKIQKVVEIVQYPPVWKSKTLQVIADIARNVIPLRWARTFAYRTGWEFWYWACLRTVVVFCTKE